MTAAPRVLLAPVTVTPTKPLGPSHLKGLLWTDVMFRATARFADVTYRYSHTSYHPTTQTVGFWEYLDRTLGDIDYSGWTDEEIGERYVAFRAETDPPRHAALRPYLDAIESGWVHPASARMLELWADQYARLGLRDPGLQAHQPPGMSVAEVVDRLSGLGLCLDLREHGGPVFADLTGDGIALRKIVEPSGKVNYVGCALRDLVPLAPLFDEVVLLYDRELEADYLLLQRVLCRLGPVVHRVPLGRVPIDGRIASARHGSRHDHTVGAILAAHAAADDDPVLRLALRLYFIAMHGPGSHESYRPDLLPRWLAKARRLLATAPGTGGRGLTDFLAAQRGEHTYVDPYRLTSRLLARHRGTPLREVLEEAYL
jgi:hypothetical protein